MRVLLFFLLVTNFLSAQNPNLFSSNWQITKIVSEVHPDQLPPPMPFQQMTTFSTNTLNSSFFNTVSANLTFSGQDQFTVISKACTLADYWGDNGEVNSFFGSICNFFGSSNGSFFYHIQSNGNEKTLVVSTPTFDEIHFKAANLNTKDQEFSKISIGPNPVKRLLKINYTENLNDVKIYDVSGKIIYEKKPAPSKTLNIDMQSFEAGIYFIRLNNDKPIKIIKE